MSAADFVLGKHRDVSLNVLSASTAAEQSRTAAERARYCGDGNDLGDALEAQAVCQVSACATLPVDAQNSRADRAALKRVERLENELDAVRRQRMTLQDRKEDARARLAKIPPAMDFFLLLGILVGLVALSLAVSLVVGLLITSSVDTFLLRSYVENVLQVHRPEASMILAVVISVGCAGGVAFVQSVTVVCTRGNIGALMKVLFIVTDLLFSGGIALMRMTHDAGVGALAISAFELAVLLAHTIALIAVARVIRDDGARRNQRQPVKDEYRSHSTALRETIEREAKLEADLSAQLQALEERDDAARRREAQEELVSRSARAEYLTTVSSMAAAAAENPSADGLTEGLDRVIAGHYEGFDGASKGGLR